MLGFGCFWGCWWAFFSLELDKNVANLPGVYLSGTEEADSEWYFAIAVERLCRKYPNFGVNSSTQLGPEKKARVWLQASTSTEQPESELGEQEGCTASSGTTTALGWGFVPDPALAPFTLLQGPAREHLPKMHRCSVPALKLCLFCASLVSSAVGRSPAAPRAPGSPPVSRWSWMRRAGSSSALGSPGGGQPCSPLLKASEHRSLWRG